MEPRTVKRRVLTPMTPRKARPNEVRVFSTEDGMFVATISRRDDGLFCIYKDWIDHDEGCQVDYWQGTEGPERGLFGSADEAEREMRSRPEYRGLVGL